MAFVVCVLCRLIVSGSNSVQWCTNRVVVLHMHIIRTYNLSQYTFNGITIKLENFAYPSCK